MKALWLSPLLAFSSQVFAGHADVTGVGRVAAEPELVVLTIDVNAECYKTPSEATQAADKIASEIYAFLGTKVDLTDGSPEALTSNGGFTQPFSRYVTLPNGQSKKACAGTFQKHSTITLKKRVANFGPLFDEIQEKVYSQYVAPADASEETSSAYATIGTPTTQLFHATQAAKEREAQTKAVEDAIAKFESLFFKRCEITGYSIVGYNEPNKYAREMPYERVQESMTAGGSSAPVNFDAHWVNSAIAVKFEYEGGHCK